MEFKRDDFQTAQAQVGTSRHAFVWAVNFAQLDLCQLLPDEELAYQLRLIALVTYAAKLGISYDDGAGGTKVGDIPVSLTVQEAQTLMHEHLRELFDRGRIVVATPKILEWDATHSTYTDAARPYELNAETLRAALDYLLSQLPQWKRRAAVCPARYARPRLRCGRWFLAKANQTFCSTTCRQREHMIQRRHASTPLIHN
jgi:hypothetical protein